MLVRFSIMILKKGELVETVSLDQRFDSPYELIEAVISFSAQYRQERLQKDVKKIYRGKMPKIVIPAVLKPKDSDTSLIIKEVKVI